jgi:hypothetical protein
VGTCRGSAPDLLDSAARLPRLGDDGTVPATCSRSSPTSGPPGLFAEAAEPELAEVLPVLVERLGGVRIRAVGNSYEPSLGEDLQPPTTTSWRPAPG